MVDTQEAARTASGMAVRLLDAYCHTGDSAADAAVAGAIERTAEHLLAWSDAINGVDRPVNVTSAGEAAEAGSADPASLRHAAMILTQVSTAAQRTAQELGGPLQTQGLRIATALDHLAVLITREAELLADAALLDRAGEDDPESQRAHRAVRRTVATLHRTAAATLRG